MDTITLTPSHFAGFFAISGDANSIHHDARRARDLGFSQPPFFGVGAIWLSLQNWAAGRRFLLHSLHARFHRPLYLARDYEVERQQSGNAVTIFWKRGGKTQLSLAFNYEWLDGSAEDLGLAPEQLRFLTWASHHCGTRFPGDGSLLISLRADFGEALEPLNTDERDGLCIQRGSRPGVRSYEFQSLQAPTRAAATAEASTVWQHARIVVTGDSCGLGLSLATQLRAAGAEVHGARCDLTDPTAARQWARSLPESLDGLILNAVPIIERADFLELGVAEWMAFLQKGLAMTLNAAENLLPRLRGGGWVELISTEYVSEPVAQLSHYVALKGALESWLRTVALEQPRLSFSVNHLPPFSSRQNTFTLRELPSADSIAQNVLRNLEVRNLRHGG